MNGEILRIVEIIHTERGINKEVIFNSIEQALILAAKKHLDTVETPVVKIDRQTGKIKAFNGDKPIDTVTLGRIAAQVAKQSIVQKIREAERDNIYSEFETRKNGIVTGNVTRFEGPHIICMTGKAEAILLKNEQVPGESFKIGDRLRTIVLNIEKIGSKVKIYLSRANENFVKRLFELEVPELAEGIILLKAIAREPGYRTKIAVYSTNEKVDCIGACVGIRGARIRNVVDELNGENMDVIRWSENAENFIKEALKPANAKEVILDNNKKKATVYIDKEELSQAIGKGGRNIRLASKLTGWEIDVTELSKKQDSEDLGENKKNKVDKGNEVQEK